MPITDIPLLAGNVVFQAIDINSTNLASGTIELTPTLSSSPSPLLLYIFRAGFEIKPGAALTGGQRHQRPDQQRRDDLGGRRGDDDRRRRLDGVPGHQQRLRRRDPVYGTLTATGTAFVKSGGGVTASILVNPGGHLVATGTNFSWDGLTLAGGSVLNKGDLAGDSFNQTISVPITDIPLLAGNVVFQDIVHQLRQPRQRDHRADPCLSSSPSPLLLYIFSAFEIKPGATLKVDSDANVQINNGVTISVDAGATMTIGAASMVYQDTNNSFAGGSRSPATLTATGTAFVKGGGGVTA